MFAWVFMKWLFMAFSVFTCDEIEWFSEKRAGEKFMELVIKNARKRQKKNCSRTTHFNDVVEGTFM